MMGEVEHEQKFVCKFCNKSCLSGKSLGGHMRCHLDLIAAAKKDKVKADISMDCQDNDHGDCGLEENPNCTGNLSAEKSSKTWIQEMGKNCRMNLEIDDQDQDSHVLRENPRKSWKISDLRIKSCHRKGTSCKQCGKEFPSVRALAGHMRTHSTKGKGKVEYLCRKCDKGFDSVRALFGHMKSHSKRYRVSTESDGLSEFEFYYPKKKRSVTRYRTCQSNSVSSAKESVSVNEIDEADKAAAICLIMLSRGLREWDGFNFLQEPSSDGNSSAFYDKGITRIGADDSLCDINQMEKASGMLDSGLIGSLNSLPEHNLSDFFCCLDKKTELDSPCSDKSNISPKDGASFARLDENKIIKPSHFTEGGNVGAMDEDEQKWADNASEIFKDPEKKREYKCRTCNMIFNCHQALGGHSNRHKMMISSCSGPNTEISLWLDDQSRDTPFGPGSSRIAMTDFEVMRSKEHECQVCFKIFPTGQALGGHKRAHYNTGPTEDRIKEIMVENQDLGDIEPILDLNHPVIPRMDASRANDVELNLRWNACARQCHAVAISS